MDQSPEQQQQAASATELSARNIQMIKGELKEKKIRLAAQILFEALMMQDQRSIVDNVISKVGVDFNDLKKNMKECLTDGLTDNDAIKLNDNLDSIINTTELKNLALNRSEERTLLAVPSFAQSDQSDKHEELLQRLKSPTLKKEDNSPSITAAYQEKNIIAIVKDIHALMKSFLSSKPTNNSKNVTLPEVPPGTPSEIVALERAIATFSAYEYGNVELYKDSLYSDWDGVYYTPSDMSSKREKQAYPSDIALPPRTDQTDLDNQIRGMVVRDLSMGGAWVVVDEIAEANLQSGQSGHSVVPAATLKPCNAKLDTYNMLLEEKTDPEAPGFLIFGDNYVHEGLNIYGNSTDGPAMYVWPLQKWVKLETEPIEVKPTVQKTAREMSQP